MDFGVFLPVSGAACTRAGLTPRRRDRRAARVHHGLGGRPDRDPVGDRDRLRLQLVGVVHRPAREAVPGVDDRAGVPRRGDRDDQARGQRAGDHLPRPGPLGEGRLDDRLAVGGPVHPRRRDRLDGARSSTRSDRSEIFPQRARVADEQLQVARNLFTEEHCSFDGEHYSYDDIAFYPKAYDRPIPIWCGGESRGAQRRAGIYGDAWFPYFAARDPGGAARRVTSNVRASAEDAGRDADEIALQLLPVGRGHRRAGRAGARPPAREPRAGGRRAVSVRGRRRRARRRCSSSSGATPSGWRRWSG